MQSNRLILKNRNELLSLDASKILFFQSDGSYTHITMSGKLQATVCMNLGQMERVLVDMAKTRRVPFARIGKMHIINLDYVYSINSLKKALVLIDSNNDRYVLKISHDAARKLKDVLLKVFGKQPAEEG